MTRNANEDAVEGIVLMRRGQNPSVVLRGLRERVGDLNGRILPKGIRIDPFYDRTELVDTTLHTVFHNLLEGAFLVTLVLFLFMLSLRASLIVAAVIPLSLLASFLYLHLRGLSANLLSMGAVDFGIIVDPAVFVIEGNDHAVERKYQRLVSAAYAGEKRVIVNEPTRHNSPAAGAAEKKLESDLHWLWSRAMPSTRPATRHHAPAAPQTHP